MEVEFVQELERLTTDIIGGAVYLFPHLVAAFQNINVVSFR